MWGCLVVEGAPRVGLMSSNRPWYIDLPCIACRVKRTCYPSLYCHLCALSHDPLIGFPETGNPRDSASEERDVRKPLACHGPRLQLLCRARLCTMAGDIPFQRFRRLRPMCPATETLRLTLAAHETRPRGSWKHSWHQPPGWYLPPDSNGQCHHHNAIIN